MAEIHIQYPGNGIAPPKRTPTHEVGWCWGDPKADFDIENRKLSAFPGDESAIGRATKSQTGAKLVVQKKLMSQSSISKSTSVNLLLWTVLINFVFFCCWNDYRFNIMPSGIIAGSAGYATVVYGMSLYVWAHEKRLVTGVIMITVVAMVP